MSRLFITGTLRSGTTFLEKLMHSHPAVSVAGQPFFAVYVELKKRFHRECGIGASLPLSTFFGAERYPPELLEAFLRAFEVGGEFLRETASVGERLPDRGSLAVTRALLSEEVLERCPMSAAELLDLCQDLAGRAYPKPGLLYSGTKEVLCEEFVPHFIGSGCKVLLVIRDPRDVAASMNYGQAAQWVGAPRPMLYIARSWRKSVHFAAANAGHENLCVCRHEDVTRDAPHRDRLFHFLGLEAPDSAAPVRDQRGQVWRPNTSFPGEAAGRQKLDSEKRLFLEALTLPEMEYMGYEPESREALEGFRISDFREDPCGRPEFRDLLGRYPRELAEEEEYRSDPGRARAGGRPWA